MWPLPNSDFCLKVLWPPKAREYKYCISIPDANQNVRHFLGMNSPLIPTSDQNNLTRFGQYKVEEGDKFKKEVGDMKRGNKGNYYGKSCKVTWIETDHNPNIHVIKSNLKEGKTPNGEGAHVPKKRKRAGKEYFEVIKDYEHTVMYKVNRRTKRKKRSIRWDFENWGKTFNKTWNFINHARMHLGIKPHKCKFWDIRFTQKENLKKHMNKCSANSLSNFM